MHVSAAILLLVGATAVSAAFPKGTCKEGPLHNYEPPRQGMLNVPGSTMGPVMKGVHSTQGCAVRCLKRGPRCFGFQHNTAKSECALKKLRPVPAFRGLATLQGITLATGQNWQKRYTFYAKFPAAAPCRSDQAPATPAVTTPKTTAAPTTTATTSATTTRSAATAKTATTNTATDRIACSNLERMAIASTVRHIFFPMTHHGCCSAALLTCVWCVVRALGFLPLLTANL